MFAPILVLLPVLLSMGQASAIQNPTGSAADLWSSLNPLDGTPSTPATAPHTTTPVLTISTAEPANVDGSGVSKPLALYELPETSNFVGIGDSSGAEASNVGQNSISSVDSNSEKLLQQLVNQYQKFILSQNNANTQFDSSNSQSDGINSQLGISNSQLDSPNSLLEDINNSFNNVNIIDEGSDNIQSTPILTTSASPIDIFSDAGVNDLVTDVVDEVTGETLSPDEQEDLFYSYLNDMSATDTNIDFQESTVQQYYSSFSSFVRSSIGTGSVSLFNFPRETTSSNSVFPVPSIVFGNSHVMQALASQSVPLPLQGAGDQLSSVLPLITPHLPVLRLTQIPTVLPFIPAQLPLQTTVHRGPPVGVVTPGQLPLEITPNYVPASSARPPVQLHASHDNSGYSRIHL